MKRYVDEERERRKYVDEEKAKEKLEEGTSEVEDVAPLINAPLVVFDEKVMDKPHTLAEISRKVRCCRRRGPILCLHVSKWIRFISGIHIKNICPRAVLFQCKGTIKGSKEAGSHGW